MSATSKANFKPMNPLVGLPLAGSGPYRPVAPPGQDALQALLAFSALQEQARCRRAKESENGSKRSPGVEHFVLDEVLQLVAERARAITGADGVAIALAEGEAIVCRGSSGEIAPDAGVRINPNSGFSGACLVSGQIVCCDDSEADPRVNVEACRRLGVRSMVAVPIAAIDTVVGLLEAFSSEPYGFNDSDVRSLKLLAELMLAALKPEEEDRLSEISRRVVATATQSGPSDLKDSKPELATLDAESATAGPASAEDQAVLSVAELLESPRRVERSHPGAIFVFAAVILASAMGGAVWWGVHGRVHKPAAKTAVSVPLQAPAHASTPAAAANVPSETQNDEDQPASGIPEEPGNGKVLVSGIRHWSSSDSCTVVIDLGDQVQYEAHRLSNPERIYFDLHGTEPGLKLPAKPIETGDVLVTRIRAAESGKGVTRIVLETKPGAEFSVRLEQSPYRLVVEVHKPGVKPEPKSAVTLFDPQPAMKNTALSALGKAGARPATAAGVSMRIALDAGHGGWDLGTVGRQGLLEKDLVLDIVGRLGKLLSDRLGVDIIYTRKDDEYLALEKRAEIANIARADLFVSIHANYSDDHSARGVETYYTNTYSSVRARAVDDESSGSLQNINWTAVDIRQKVLQSHRFAASIQHALYNALASQNPGIRNRGVKEAQYAVLTGTTMPAILAEVSFVSSPIDETELQGEAYRQRIAEALYDGIAHYVHTSQPTVANALPKQASQ